VVTPFWLWEENTRKRNTELSEFQADIDISPEQWDHYENRYGKLMWKISHKISGDKAISEPEDNYGDLCITAIESIRGFHKKTGESVEEMFGNKLFDAYTKTCLWHKKNSKGANITKKFPLTNKTFSMSGAQDSQPDEDSVFTIEDPAPGPDMSLEIYELFGKFNHTQGVILDEISRDPSIIMGTGRINMSKLSKITGLPSDKLKFEIGNMEKEYGHFSS